MNAMESYFTQHLDFNALLFSDIIVNMQHVLPSYICLTIAFEPSGTQQGLRSALQTSM
jgi:hypothetical protein